MNFPKKSVLFACGMLQHVAFGFKYATTNIEETD